MKKVLFTATVDIHILKFHIPYLKYFKENGYEVHVASNGTTPFPYVDFKHNVPFERSPFKIGNMKAYKDLKGIIENNDYDLIHCHTPMGSMITRLAARIKRKKGTKVVYTAHGFHFFKGSSLLSWIIYYPIEKWFSNYTDCLITINNEDYLRAVKGRFKSGVIKKVNGVGVDLEVFTPPEIQQKRELRKKYNLKDNDFVLVCAAELNHNKHQDLLINAVDTLTNKIPHLKLLLAGQGECENKYRQLVKTLKLEHKVLFLGYRRDIKNIYMLSDIAVSASRREGLPVNVIEAMAVGLPLIVTDCRGNRDLVVDGLNGLVIGDDVSSFAGAIESLYKASEKRIDFGKQSTKLVKKYSIYQTLGDTINIYNQILGYPDRQSAQYNYSNLL